MLRPHCTGTSKVTRRFSQVRVVPGRVEPPTSSVSDLRSNQLSYGTDLLALTTFLMSVDRRVAAVQQNLVGSVLRNSTKGATTSTTTPSGKPGYRSLFSGSSDRRNDLTCSLSVFLLRIVLRICRCVLRHDTKHTTVHIYRVRSER